MAQPRLPDKDHIVRFVPWAKVFKDDEDQVLGIAPTAYQLRADEDELSVNWLERADPDPSLRLQRTVEMMGAGMRIGAKARVAISNVGSFASLCKKYGAKVRIVHNPEDGNEPHSEIHRLPRDDMELLEVLATEGVISHHRCKDIAP